MSYSSIHRTVCCPHAAYEWCRKILTAYIVHIIDFYIMGGLLVVGIDWWNKKHTESTRTVQVTCSSPYLLLDCSIQCTHWLVICPVYNPWRETDCTLQHDRLGSNHNSTRYTFIVHTYAAGFGCFCKGCAGSGETWLSCWHLFEPHCHFARKLTTLFYSSLWIFIWSVWKIYNILTQSPLLKANNVTSSELCNISD